jgi:hypothetical protein
MELEPITLHTLEDLAGHYLSIYQRICCLPFIIQLVQQYEMKVLTQVPCLG